MEKEATMYTRPFPLAATVRALRTGQVDLPAYINDACDYIEETEPQIEALAPEVNRRERLLQEAAALQEHFPTPETRPALYGVLLGIKDVLRAAGFTTHAGSQLPPELFAGPESSCVKKLREAGALVVGMTVAAEFAFFEPGPTRNPHHPAHTPGGSSSGSAAAVAAGYCQLALGTQTSGSIIRPAAYCGIVGFKPSSGRIATDGLIFCAKSLDTIGYLTQDIAGTQLVAPLLCVDWKPVVSLEKKPVLGVPEGPYLTQASSEALMGFEQNLAALEKAGYTVRRTPTLSDIEALNHRHARLVAAEMAQAHADWFGQYEVLYRPRTAQAIREGQEISYPEYDLYRASPRALRTEMEMLMESSGIDLWVCPTTTGPAPEGTETTGNPAMNLTWTHAGLPVVTLPTGRAESGLPLGLQCVGRFLRDEALLAWAGEMAQIFNLF
jgi:Asp-tRNA(Asn)/Glu-tRNA(Gln) amidotransferase A subunit family amidase